MPENSAASVVAADIRKRIADDFSSSAGAVEARIADFVSSFRSTYGHHPGDRVIRCILQLAESKLPHLEHYMKAALADWRDVIAWAEYDKNEARIFDFNVPFEYAARKPNA